MALQNTAAEESDDEKPQERISRPSKLVLRTCRQLIDGVECGERLAVDPKEIQWCVKCLHRKVSSMHNKRCECGGKVERDDGSIRCNLCISMGKHIHDEKPDSAVSCINAEHGCKYWTYDLGQSCYRCIGWSRAIEMPRQELVDRIQYRF